MSYEATRWAWGQDAPSAMTKLLLLAMADCVNSEGAEMVCWPSYAFLARRTGMNTKTVEAGVFRLKQVGLIVDTGKREGGTGKVIVYRLNDPKSGVVTPGPQEPSANGTRPQNTPENGCITPTGNPPKFGANPPKNGGQSPQKVGVTTPKAGDGTSNRTKNRTRKEPGISVTAIPGVPDKLLSDWLVVRKDKKAGTLTETAVDGLLREAAKAGLTAEEAVRTCIERNWIGLNAGWLADSPARGTGKLNAQEALEASNREVAARFLAKDDPYAVH